MHLYNSISNHFPQRKSVRLSEYDYSSSGWYFITICTQNHYELFGKIVDSKMILNEYGKIVEKVLLKLPQRYKNVELDEYVIMPNHFHGIIVINNDDDTDSVGAGLVPAREMGDYCETGDHKDLSCDHKGRPYTARDNENNKPTIGNITGAFKSITTNEYIRGVKIKKWTPFNYRIWQRNYYEHIIRNEKSLNKIRQYIIDNPPKWEIDKYNPKNIEKF
ncbi:MAG TPA: transposase [Candidatus Portnoybacteria bacterium]|nr:transposase [Candidatus Portnoybacteria bacterium]